MILLILMFLSFSFRPPVEESCIDWHSVAQYEFYKLPSGRTAEMITWKEIEKLKHVQINQAAPMLSSSQCKSVTFATWMDIYLLVVRFKDGKQRKVKISGYGSFLAEPGGKFYYIKEEDKEKWQQLIIEAKAQISK